MKSFTDFLKTQFDSNIELREKRPNIFQLIAPLFHEDGDIVEIFLEWCTSDNKLVRISDYGLTLMRLSYTYDIDTPNKKRIFNQILRENGIENDDGNLYILTKPDSIYPAILQFAQVVGKVTNMSYFKREVIRSLFYEMLSEFVDDGLKKYYPQRQFLPIPERDEYEVDYKLEVGKRPLYLFGVKDVTKARLVTISCLEFMRAQIPFRSVAILEDSEILGRKDRDRLTSAVDKQFPTLDDLKENGIKYFDREAA
jgi:hypothetical protein